MNLVGRKVLTVRTVNGTHVEGLGNVKTMLTQDSAKNMNMVLVDQGVYVSGNGLPPESKRFEFVLPFNQCISIQLVPYKPSEKVNEENNRQ